MPSLSILIELYSTHQKFQFRRNATSIFTKPQRQVWPFWEIMKSFFNDFGQLEKKFMISRTGPSHCNIPFKFVHIPPHHLSLCFTHMSLRSKRCSPRLNVFLFQTKKKKISHGKDENKMSHATKGRTWKETWNSSFLFAAGCNVLLHIRSWERKVRMCPFCSMARHIQCWNQSIGLPQCWNPPFPQPGRQCQKKKKKKNKLNFAMLQHRQAKALYQNYAMLQVTANSDHRQSSHGEVKLECLQQIGQKHASFTWSHQTEVFSSLTQKRRNLLYLAGPLLVYTKPCFIVTKMISWGKPGI